MTTRPTAGNDFPAAMTRIWSTLRDAEHVALRELYEVRRGIGRSFVRVCEVAATGGEAVTGEEVAMRDDTVERLSANLARADAELARLREELAASEAALAVLRRDLGGKEAELLIARATLDAARREICEMTGDPAGVAAVRGWEGLYQ
jgi:hypothetical protein